MRWSGPNITGRRELEEARGQLAACAASNNRLNSELEARTRELTATGDVLKVISRSAFDLQTVLNSLTESAARLCGADTAIIRRREGDAYPVAATYGLTKKQRDHFAIYPTSPSRESVFGRAVMECRTIHVPDVLADPEYNRPQLQDFVAVRAMLGVPLIRDGLPIGVFTLQRREPLPYSEQQMDLVTTFADQAVIAIENVRLFEEVKARTSEAQESLEYQTATSDVLNVISRSPTEIQPVLDTIVQTAAQLCDAKRAFIYRYDGAVLRHQASHNASPELKEFVTRNPISPGRHSGVARAAFEKCTIHISDVRSDPEYTFGAAQVDPIRTVLAVPMLKARDLVGVLVIYRLEVRPFTRKQIELVTTFADQAVIAIENARLFEEVQARTAELQEALEYQTATSDVLNVISRSPSDLQPVLAAVGEKAARLCEADNAVIFRLEGDLLRQVGSFGKTPAISGPLNRARVVTRAVFDRRTIHVHDLQAEADEFPEGSAHAKRAGHRTTLATPLLRDGVPLGAILIRRLEVRPFSNKQIKLLETFADQAVIAIENARLFEEVQARTRELTESLEYQTATSDVLNVISRAPSLLQPVFDVIVDTAARLCEADYAAVHQLRDGQCQLRAVNNAEAEYAKYLRDNPMPLERGSVVGRTALEGRAVHLPDCLADPDYTRRGYQRAGGFRTILGVPLLREGVTIGVITMLRNAVRPFADKQIELVQTFADQAVIAIENVRLFDEVQARTRELQEALEYQTATSNVLNVISRSPNNLQPVLDAIVETAHDLCRARYAIFFRLGADGLYHLAASKDADAVRSLDWLRSHPVAKGDGTATGLAALEQCTIHFPDAFADPRATDLQRQQQSKARTQVAVPLMRAGEVIGVIFLARTEVLPFTERQIDLVTTFADQAVIAIENVRLFEEVQTRTRELQLSLEYQTATSDVLNVISRSPSDLQPVLNTIVETAARLCEAYDAIITLKEGNDLKIAAHHGPIPVDFGKWSTTRGWVTGRAVADRKPVHVDDLAAASNEYPDGHAMALRLGHRTILAVPLLRDDVALGAISIRRTEVRPFSEKQVALLQIFADQAVIAIENVRLFEAVQLRTAELAKSVGELRALGEVTQAVNSTLDLETVLDTIVAKAVELSGTDAGAIYVYSKSRERFRLRSTYGMSQELITALTHEHVGPGSSYIGAATQERHPVQIPDLLEEPPSSIRQIVLSAGYRALLVVPLLRPGRIVGALVVRRRDPGEFSLGVIELLQTFATQSVIAIQNARLFEDVEARTRELAASLQELRAAQDRLVQTEKLASLGQLTAGIAHEIKNPLNFVNNFAALSIELVDELQQELAKPVGQFEPESVGELASMLTANLDKVVQHGKRADSIVKHMLLHSRSGSGERTGTNVNALVEESLNLAYHGARAAQQGFNITLKTELDPTVGEVELYPQEVTRVLLNLISNGFYAATKRAAQKGDGDYRPTLTTTTHSLGDGVEIRIRDNGVGIPPEIREKVFEPFFTTKPAGEGTGLGLSLSYDIIVKQHSGVLEVHSEPGEYTEFRIVLPRAAYAATNSGGDYPCRP